MGTLSRQAAGDREEDRWSPVAEFFAPLAPLVVNPVSSASSAPPRGKRSPPFRPSQETHPEDARGAAEFAGEREGNRGSPVAEPNAEWPPLMLRVPLLLGVFAFLREVRLLSQ